MMSVVLQTNDYRLEKTYAFNAVVAVACCSFLQNISGENFKIKWPNDLMWRDRKAGGILIENIIRGNDWLWSVVGTGLNINQHKFTNIDTAVSVRQITGKTYDVVELAKQLQNCLIEAVEKSASGNMAVYNELLYKKGEQVTFKKDSIVFTGIVDHVDEYGQLYLSDHPESISFGEVRWLLR